MGSSADEAKVREAIAEFLGRPPAEVAPDAELRDLVEESFVLVELVVELQEIFAIQLHGQDLQGVKTVRQLVDLVRRTAV